MVMVLSIGERHPSRCVRALRVEPRKARSGPASQHPQQYRDRRRLWLAGNRAIGTAYWPRRPPRAALLPGSQPVGRPRDRDRDRTESGTGPAPAGTPTRRARLRRAARRAGSRWPTILVTVAVLASPYLAAKLAYGCGTSCC